MNFREQAEALAKQAGDSWVDDLEELADFLEPIIRSAYAAGLERAAKICEQPLDEDLRTRGYIRAPAHSIRQLAVSIRYGGGE